MSEPIVTARDADALVRKLKRLAGNQFVGADRRSQEHWVSSVRWGFAHRGFATAAAVLSAVAGASIFSDAQGGWRVAAGVVALIASALAAVEATLKGGELAESHKRGYDGFTALRTKWLQYQNFTCDSGLAPDELVSRFEALVNERDELSKQVPVPGFWAKRTIRRRVATEEKRKASDSQRAEQGSAVSQQAP